MHKLMETLKTHDSSYKHNGAIRIFFHRNVQEEVMALRNRRRVPDGRRALTCNGRIVFEVQKTAVRVRVRDKTV